MFLLERMDFIALVGLFVQAFLAWVFVAVLASLRKRDPSRALDSFLLSFACLATALTVLCAVVERHAGVMAAFYRKPPRPLPTDPGRPERTTSIEFIEPFERLLTDGTIDGSLASTDPKHDATLVAMQLAARTEGMVTDPVYEGKSMAGMVDLIERGEIDADSTVLYAHLGGQPALNAYSGVIQ